MPDVRRMRLLGVAIAALLPACGGSGGGGGGGGPPAPLPVVDVALRQAGPSNPRIHVYRDVLHGAASGHAPDVRIGPPTGIAFMGFTGAELVLAADLGLPSGNRIWVYTQADLAVVPTIPSVQCLLPPPAGAANVAIKDMVVHDGDVYVLSLYNDGLSPLTFTWVTHVFRDVTTLLGGAAPDATITHEQFTTSAIFIAHDTLAVDDDVLLVTGHNRVHVNLQPGGLSGAEVPDTSILLANLNVSSTARVALGQGAAYFYSPLGVSAYAAPTLLSAGQFPDFLLQGPSSVFPGQGAILRLGGRLFTRGLFSVSPIALVGFDVSLPPADFAPPDVMLGPPVVGDQRLDGAADTLCAATVNGGFVSVYPRASLLLDGAEPSVYLYDPDILQAAEVRAVPR